MKRQTSYRKKGFFALLAFMLLALQAVAQSLPSKIEDGVILHCFNWKYADIKAELSSIKAAGFVAVQTSPAQTNYTGQTSWNTLYRPRDSKAGPNTLGTSSDLKALCDAAHALGIKVIVDVVANHTDGSLDWVADFWKDTSLYHDFGLGANDGNRYNVTHGNIGMHDLKTEDSRVQQKFKAYVQELKGLGVDGIRWDAAKHIGLPSEGDNFWSAVIDKSMFNYGEILNTVGGGQDDKLLPEYMNYMSVTDSPFCSDNILGAFKSNSVPSSSGNYSFKYSTSKLVYWGESHDNYCNDGDKSDGVSQDKIDRAYAIAASHNGIPALYFSRPSGRGSSSQAGVKGSTHFKDKVVAEVNKFHNAMAGKSDYYSAQGNACSSTRKGGGAIIVTGGNGGNVSVPNGGGYAVPGTYTDRVGGGSFTVTATTISGNVGSTGVAVLWKDDQGGQGGGGEQGGGGGDTPDPQPTLPSCATTQSGTYCYFENTSGWSSVSVWAWNGSGDNVQNLYAAWPGSAEHLKKVGTNNGNDVYLWQYSGNAPESIIFNDGKADGAAQTEDLSFVNGGYYNAGGYVATVGNSGQGGGGGTTSGLPACATYVDNAPFCYFEGAWSSVYVWAWMDGQDGSDYLGTAWPGVAITQVGTNNGNTVFQWISSNSQMPDYVIFNNGSGGEGNQTDNLAFTNGGYYNQSGALVGTVTKNTNPTPGPEPDPVASIQAPATVVYATVNVYSLDGRLVRRNADAAAAVSGLEKGLYIVNGKKVVVR